MEAVVLSHSGELSLWFDIGGFMSSSGEPSLRLDIFCFGVVHVGFGCRFREPLVER